MGGSDDPVAPSPPRATAKPPDPAGQEPQGGGEVDQASRSSSLSQPLELEYGRGKEEDESMPLSGPDSIVAETQESQTEDEDTEDKVPTVGIPAVQVTSHQQHGLETGGQAEAPAGPGTVEHVGELEEETPTVQPEEMFAAVVAAMQDARGAHPRDEWVTTIAELFAIAHDTVAIDAERVPMAKRRYPKLKGDERALLMTMFTEAFITSKGTYADWIRYATTMTKDLYNTRWTLKLILENLIGKVKWAREQPMNLWAAKVKAGTTNEVLPNGTVKRYQTYMFNPSNFSKTDIVKLMGICEQPVSANHGRKLREGTKEEWQILGGMAEGNIVCRKMPDFAKSLLDSKEITRLNRTIQLQVEGELVMQLRGRGGINAKRRSTRAIKDDIMLAAVAAGVNLDEVQHMLNMTKTISYNYGQRSVHFFFFDRATARKYQLMCIPFQKQMHALVNMHGPAVGTVWERQLARDGTRPSAIREYAVLIHNVTRFTDVGRLTAFLEQHIGTGFDLEDMDTCTPDSTTSTVWKLTMKSMECPDFLRGIVRIVWFGRTLILQHPAMGYRMQCFRCGNTGHPMARCRYTDSQLTGSGSRVAVDREVAQLEDLAKPFTSLADMQVTAQKRLAQQAAAVRKAEAAVRPVISQEQRHNEAQLHSPVVGLSSAQEQANEPSAAHQIAPAPKQPRVTLLRRNGTKLYANAATLEQGFSVAPSRYAVLDDQAGMEGEREEKAEDNSPEHETVEISSGEDIVPPQPRKITAKEKARLHLVKAKPQTLIPTPQLVALKQRQRKALAKVIDTLKPLRGDPVPLSNQPGGSVVNDNELEARLGLRRVATPASGNCMAMALAQALTDLDLAEQPEQLEAITAIIKRGVGWSGQLNFLEQFNHFTRMTTLINVGRGWESMDAHESSKQFRWYLHDYANSSSNPEVFIPRYNWGSSEVMALAASFLQRKVFVMAYDVDHTGQWHCSMYKPGSGTKGRKIFEKGVQVSLQVERWMVEVQKEKAKGKEMPLVIRYWGEHFSAYVHTQPAGTATPPNDDQQDEPMEEEPELFTSTNSQQSELEASAESQRGVSQEPWDQTTWDGNVAELRQRLAGLSIPHDLQREIYLILENAEPQRYTELLTFLVNTASQLSVPQRERLLAMDLGSDSNAGVKAVLQEFQLSLPVLRQWQQDVRSMQEEARAQMQQQEVESEPQSDSDYVPSQSSVPSQERQLSQDHSRNKQQGATAWSAVQATSDESTKRSHTLSLIEGEAIRQVLRSQTGPIPVEKQQTVSEADQQVSLTEKKGDERSTWADQWLTMRSIWPLTAKISFPTASSPMSAWTDTARKEPVWLLRTVQRFALPEELLAKLSNKAFEAWTSVWRTECLYGRLVAMRSKSTDPAVRQWLDGWKRKLEHHPHGTLPPLVDNSEDWQTLRSQGYGGDEILKLCDVSNRLQFAHHTICAFVYEHEIKVLTNLEQEAENGAQTRLVRHLLAMSTLPEYKQAYCALHHTVDWRAVAEYFRRTLVQEGPGDINQSEGSQ